MSSSRKYVILGCRLCGNYLRTRLCDLDKDDHMCPCQSGKDVPVKIVVFDHKKKTFGLSDERFGCICEASIFAQATWSKGRVDGVYDRKNDEIGICYDFAK